MINKLSDYTYIYLSNKWLNEHNMYKLINIINVKIPLKQPYSATYWRKALPAA